MDNKTLKILLTLGCFFLFKSLFAQIPYYKNMKFTRQDSLRGSINPARRYDVYFYNLKVRIDPADSTIEGSNEIYFNAQDKLDSLQIDLFQNLTIDAIIFEKKSLKFKRVGNATFAYLPQPIQTSKKGKVVIKYHGNPTVAKRPPWDGGLVWSQDANGNDWISVACEGIGASIWWPNKDHLSDEPDSMALSFEVPETLFCVSNGHFKGSEKTFDGFERYNWFVSNPINNYDVTFYAGIFTHFSDSLLSKVTGKNLDLNYYVLKYNLTDAQKQFEQVKGMINCYEKYFGPYPFYKDGFKLVEAPYWGMEHQSAVAYGNHYKNNAFGFDFIIIHESAHEWWGNSLSVGDHGEMWIHEAFATYAEALYLECRDGYNQSVAYLQMQKEKIQNNQPILGPTGVNYKGWPDADMYYKGTWMLHTIRNVINNDSLWFDIIYHLATEKSKSIVTTQEIIDFINSRTKYDLQPIFDQYLKYKSPPVLDYILKKENEKMKITFKWETDVKDFRMPVEIKVHGTAMRAEVNSEKWTTLSLNAKDPSQVKIVNDKFYFEEKNMDSKP